MSGAVLRNAALPVSRWHNGAGRKADLASGDGWLVGFAWLDADAPFSRLPGTARTITLVEGPGFTLDVAGRMLAVEQLFVPARFDGGQPTQCRVLGPCRVLNAMTSGGFSHSVTVGAVPEPQAGVACFAVLLAGSASVGGVTLGLLDAVSLNGPAAWQGSGDSQVATVTIQA